MKKLFIYTLFLTLFFFLFCNISLLTRDTLAIQVVTQDSVAIDPKTAEPKTPITIVDADGCIMNTQIMMIDGRVTPDEAESLALTNPEAQQCSEFTIQGKKGKPMPYMTGSGTGATVNSHPNGLIPNSIIIEELPGGKSKLTIFYRCCKTVRYGY